jgi:hypothetical protein
MTGRNRAAGHGFCSWWTRTVTASCLSGPDCRPLALDLVQQGLQALTGALKTRVTQQFGPLLFDLGNAIAGVVECSPSFGRREDQLRAAIRGIGPAFQIAEALQLIDEFGGRREAQLRVACEMGQPDSADPDIAENMQVRFPDICVTTVLGGREQVSPECCQQADQQLTDGQPIGGQVS